MVKEVPINERIAVLETDMETVKQSVKDTKDDIRDINKAVRGSLLASLGGALLILADIALHMKP